MLNLPFIRGLAVVLGLALTPCHAADLMLRTSDVQIIGNGPLIANGIEGEARDPSLPVVDPTDINGSATLPLTLSPVFAGAVINFQWATLDAGGALLGTLSTSPGLEIVLGL